MENREIKFRAWDKGNEIMIYSLPHSRLTVGEVIDRFETLMQYTGLKDKNGKEIYEGDVMEFDKREWGGNDNIHLVSWDSENGEWNWGGGVTSDMEWRKIIGNIYKNPELIKQPDEA